MKEYLQKTKQNRESVSKPGQPEQIAGISNSALESVLSGRSSASSEMMGQRQDLAPSMNAKMSRAFGMDLSQVRFYRSKAMEGQDIKGLSRGNRVVLSKDIDLNTTAGQAILGHELSHVRAQSQGIGLGHSGLYQNAELERQADAEGMMAAHGMSILGESGGMDSGPGMDSINSLTPLGPGMGTSAGAPMQAFSLKHLFGGGKSKSSEQSGKSAEQSAKSPVPKEESIDWDTPSSQFSTGDSFKTQDNRSCSRYDPYHRYLKEKEKQEENNCSYYLNPIERDDDQYDAFQEKFETYHESINNMEDNKDFNFDDFEEEFGAFNSGSESGSESDSKGSDYENTTAAADIFLHKYKNLLKESYKKYKWD